MKFILIKKSCNMAHKVVKRYENSLPAGKAVFALKMLLNMSEDYRKDVLAILADGFEPLYEFFYIIHFLNILNKYGFILLIISGI